MTDNTIPDFEGKEVAFTKAKITSASNLEIDDQSFRIDDMIRIMVECRVSRVDHQVNEKTGHLERIHTFKAIEGTIIPWEIEITP